MRVAESIEADASAFSQKIQPKAVARIAQEVCQKGQALGACVAYLKEVILKNLSFLNELGDDFTRSGYIGDTSLPKLIWLATTTRYFDKPVSVVVLGPSGSGKSFALDTALKFVPDDAYYMFHGMSEKAIMYSDDLHLQHKHLVIQEAAGMQHGQGKVFLRQLLSEGEARYRTVMSRDGELVSEDLRIKGPTGLLMTTTDTGIHEEDASRMLCVHMEEDQDLIRQVLKAQATAGKSPRSKPKIKRWKKLVEKNFTNSTAVNIPYAGILVDHLPVSHHRVMRDFPHVLSLISACALLHRSEREVDERQQVVADLDDYEIVHSLVVKHLAQGLDKSVHESVRDVVLSVEKLGKKNRRNALQRITQNDVAVDLNWSRSVVSRNVAKAIALGYLVDENPGQGKQSDLNLGERKLENSQSDVLPNRKLLERSLDLG